MTSTKNYWSLLKTLLNRKKIPCVPPIFHKNKYVTDFKEKIEIINSFFAEQCSLLPHRSVLKSSCDFSKTDILKIINNQDSNKVHDHDMITIRVLKLCDESVYGPLNIIFKTCLRTGKFPL